LDRAEIEAGAVVGDLEPEVCVAVAPEADFGLGVRSGVLGDVLKTLEAAEVDGDLDVLRVSADAGSADRRGGRRDAASSAVMPADQPAAALARVASRQRPPPPG
jgi:hypothetical protein